MIKEKKIEIPSRECLEGIEPQKTKEAVCSACFAGNSLHYSNVSLRNMSCLSRAPDQKSNWPGNSVKRFAASGILYRWSKGLNYSSKIFFEIINLILKKSQKFVDMFSDRPEKVPISYQSLSNSRSEV